MADDLEASPLVESGSRGSVASNPRRTVLVAVGASLALVGVATLTTSASSSARNAAAEGAVIRLDQADGLTFELRNEYGSAVPGDGFYPWSFIAEPHKVSTFLALEPEGIQFTAGATTSFHWHIPTQDKMEWGSSLKHTFTSTGVHDINLARYELNPSTGVKAETHRFKTTVAVKYVKREVRALSENDRENFLNALYTVFTTSSEKGVGVYGRDFAGIEHLVREHLYGSGQRDCDHWHDDAGIMTHHLGFTLKMELALQSVDPSVTVPYWEYTKDDSIFGSEWGKSPIFQQDWFGNPGSNLGEGHFIEHGRWANLAVMGDATGYSEVTNPFGLLRSPWNLNGDPFVARSSSVVGMTYMGGALPGCGAIKTCFDSTTVADMNTCLNGQTHGPVHVLVGGQWDVELGDLSSKLIGTAHLLLFKNLWRKGYASCPTTSDELLEMGGSCGCAADVTAYVGGAYAVLAKSKSLHYMAMGAPSDVLSWDQEAKRWTLPGMSEEDEEGAWKDVLNKLCDPGKVGEMYSSAAPYDPLFWVIHTTSERLLQYRRLRSVASAKDPTALPFDQTWGYTHMDADSDLGVTCDWQDVDAQTGLPACSTGTCEGHNANDVLPFDLSSLSRALSAATTNQEFYDWLDPMNGDIPYVYDSFKYEHCASAGIEIGAAVDASDSGPPPTSKMRSDSAGHVF